MFGDKLCVHSGAFHEAIAEVLLYIQISFSQIHPACDEAE